VVLALLGAACSGGPEVTSTEVDPTFRRATGSAIAYEEPVARVADLLAPAAEGEPWLVLGSVFDPESGMTVAATWSADDGRNWERTDVEPASRRASEVMTAGARDADGGLLAVGRVGDDAAADAAIWRHDGEEWKLSVPDALGGEHEQWAFDAAVGEGGILVAGGESVWGEVRPRLWFSADGSSWESVDGGPGGPFDANGSESVRGIAAVGAGFVAVGSTVDDHLDGAVWFSPDGTTWSRLEAASLGGPGRQALESVTWTGDVVVAGGYRVDGNGQGQPVVWRSADGQEWGDPSAPLELHGDQRTAAADYAVSGLSYDDGRLTAIGGNDWRPHLWGSGDGGASWALLPNPVHGTLFADGVALVDSAHGFGTRIAIGSEPSVLFLDASDRWQDASGKAFPNGGAQPFATSLAIGDGATVAAGYRHRAPQGTERERFSGQVWLERGGGWDAIDSENLAAGQITDLGAYAGGFVAVGTEDFGVAAQRRYLGDKQPDGLIWTSADGKEWTRVGAITSQVTDEELELIEDPDASQAGTITQILASQPPETVEPAGGKGVRSLDAAAALADGFIAVGVAYVDGDADPVVVVSPDGAQLSGENPGAGGAGTQRFRDVCVRGDSAIAVGTSGTGDDYDVLVRQRAADGTWSTPTHDGSFGGGGNQQAYGCAAGEAGFVVVGSDDRSGDADARVWTSEDGLDWTRVESGLLGGAGDQWASAAAEVPGAGWLVGGTDTVEGDGDVALWRLLPSGEISRRDRGEPELGGTGQQSVSAIAVDGDRVIITGHDHGRVGIWESGVVDR
jgi:hypothetical protein